MTRTKAGHPTCDSTSEARSNTGKSDSITFISATDTSPVRGACEWIASARTLPSNRLHVSPVRT
jgi:hypothetical protein